MVMHRALTIAALTALSASCGSPANSAPPSRGGRVAWTTSRVAGRPDPPLPYEVREAYSRLSFRHPLYMSIEPTTGRALVVTQHGKIFAFKNEASAEKADLFLELKGMWFYSMRFHPGYERNHWVYVFANGPEGTEPHKKNRILRYEVKGGKCDPSTESLVIEWVSNGHDGGEMGFGPDGMLYITAGDGTTDSDGNNTGQDLSDLNSGMLRIDIEHPDPGRSYSIPSDNPFVTLPGVRGELWAYGFRNPWRMTFDPKTGDLWVGDIGQDLWEMIEVVHRGDNYGWSVYEGGHPFLTKRKLGPTPVTPAVIVHPHSEARSITGGIVYTGRRFPDLRGAYLYGDYGTGKIWMARYSGGRISDHRELADTPYQILGFAQDSGGNIFIVDYGGRVYRLEPTPPDQPHPEFPRTLSASGVFTSVGRYQVDPGIFPYSVNAPLWSDGAFKQRHLGIPGSARIGFTEEGAWDLPRGTVLVKTFSIQMDSGHPESLRRIETRFLYKDRNEWAGYSYEWNDAQTDATLVEAGGRTRRFRIKDPSVPSGWREQSWYFPSRADCMVCHSRAAGFVLGLNTLQMNRAGQLEMLEAAGYFQMDALEHLRVSEERWKRRLVGPLRVVLTRVWSEIRESLARRIRLEDRITTVLPKAAVEFGRLANPYDPAADLDRRARSYLHSNCAQCHVESGGGNSAFDLHIRTEPGRMKVFDIKPQHDTFEISDARIIAPGDPERSILYRRITRRGPGQMPPLATNTVDEQAAAMLRDWISGLLRPR